MATCGSEKLQEPDRAPVFLEEIAEQDDVTLTEADGANLKALETWLDMYREIRTAAARSASLENNAVPA